MGKRRLALLLTLAMILSMFPINAFATEFSDMPDDWSTKALENAVANGLLKGDNGKIMPNENLTRAQMATIVNRAFGATEKSSIDGFTDVKKDAWHYDEMSKAVQMKTFIGSGDKLYPDNSITREEAFIVLARAFKLSGVNENALDKFSDKDNISDWAVDGVASLVAAGYIAGSNGRINPKQNITRAEFAQVMDNLLKNYINKEGTYTEDYSGNLMINVPNVTLKGLTVTGDLIIGDGVGDGEVTLDDVTVTGRVLVRGGGENSIKIIGNSNIKNIIIARVDGIVRIYAEDGTEIGEVIVDGNDDVIIEGGFTSVTIVGPDITVTATNASIESASIEGENSNIIIDENSSVKTINVNASNVEINGEGTVESVIANANNVEVKVPGASVTAGEGTTGVTAGDKPVEPGKTETVPKEETTSSGGGSDSSRVEVSAISVEGVAKVGETLTAKVTPEKATVTYKWMRADAEDGEYVAIAGATDKTYTLSEADAGKWIKVEVKGTGNYTGTKSKVVGPVEEVEEPIETIEAIIDYNAVWNESRGTWYIKVTVPDENLDAGSVKSIHAITEAGVDLDEPRELTPDTDTVMWFGVAKGDGEVTLKADGEYAYKVVRLDDSEYIFNFTYASSEVQGVEEVEEPIETIEAIIDYNAVWNESRGTWYIKVTVPDENLDAGSVKSIHAITEAGVDLDEPRELTPDTDTVMWFGVAKGDGEVTLKADGEYAYKVVRLDDSEYIFNFTYASSEVQGVEEVEEPIETIEAIIDYNAVWNESRGTWYIKVTVPDENLDAGSVKSIHAITEAGVDLDEPRELTPDTDTVMWFGVAKGDGEVTLKADGEYAYKVVRLDDSEYIFNFTYASSEVQGVEEVEEPIETIEAIIDYNAVWNESRGTWYIKVTVPDENLDAGSVKSIHAITEAGVDLDEPRELTPDTDTVMWFGVAKGDGEVTLKADGEYAYKVVRLDDSEYIFNFTYASSEVQGVEEVEEPIETIEAIIDYNAVWNESRGTWYIKVTVPDENLDAGSVKSIHAITEAGVDLDEPRELTPDTDTVMWFGVAKGDGEVTLKADGEYAYKVVRLDDSEYIFNFTYASSEVQGVEEVEEPIETIEAIIDYNAVWNESRGTWYIKVTVPDENLDAGSVKSIHAITEAGVDLDEPRELTPDTDTVMWFGVAKGDGEVTLKADGEYAYKVVRLDDSEYIFNFTYASSEVQGVEEVEEPIETIEAIIDYNAVWNESRGTWYIKVTVPDENLDAGSVKSIHAITEAGVDLDEPRELTPDTDTVMWFGVAKGDGEVTLKADGEYAYKVVRLDDSEYIFNFTYASSEVQGVEEVEEPIETIEAIIDYNAVWNESRGTWYIKVTVPDENLDAGSVKSIHAITEAGVDLDEPRELTPDTDTVMWFGVAKGDGEVTLKADGEYAYKVVRKDGSEYIFSFTYDSSKVTGLPEPVEEKGAEIDYAARYNETRKEWYVKVTVDGEDLDADSINEIWTIKKAGQELDEPQKLTPDADKVLWLPVAGEDGVLYAEKDGEYAYKVVRKDGSEYIFSFTYDSSKVTGLPEPVEEKGAEIDYAARYNETRKEWYVKVTVDGEDLDADSINEIWTIKKAGQELDEPQKLTPDADKVLWLPVAGEDGVLYAEKDGEYAYKVVRKDGSEYIFSFTYDSSKVTGLPEPVEEKGAEIDYAARYNETRKEWYVKVTVDGEDLDADSINEIWTIKKAGQELDEPQKLTPDADKVLWLPVAGEDGVLYAEKDGEYAYKVVRKDGSEYIFSFTYDSSKVTGLPEPVEEKGAEIDYAARYNETRKEWYVKVTVDGEDLDADSINEIWTIKKAGQELDEPQKLTPDADKVLWLPVAGEDGVLYAEKDGEYAYKVVRKDGSEYIFSFTYDSSKVTGLPEPVEEKGAEIDYAARYNETRKEWYVKVTVDGEDLDADSINEIWTIKKAGQELDEPQKLTPDADKVLWLPVAGEDGVLYAEKDGEYAYKVVRKDGSEYIFSFTYDSSEVTGLPEPVEEKGAEIDYAARYNETRKEWYVKVTVDGEDLDADSINEIWTIKKAGQELDEPQKLTPDADKVLWLPVAGEDGVLYAEKDGEYAYKVVRKDGSEYIFSFTYDSSEVTGLPEPVEEKGAEIDYAARYNETRKEWYVKVTVDGEDLDADSINEIWTIKKAGQELDEPQKLTPDADKVLWLPVAGEDGVLYAEKDGEYAYKVVRKDGSEYIFSFTYASSEVKGVEKVTTPGKLEGATDYAGYNEWSAAITDDGIDFSKITKDQAIAMGLPDVDYYGIAMKLVVGEETIDLNTTNLTKVERVTPSGDVQSALVTETGTVQFVHDGWGGPGEYTMLYTLKDGTIIEAKINVVSFEFKPVVLDGELVPATDYPGYDSWKDAITEEGIDFGQITKDQAIAMGLPGVDYYGVAMYLEVDGEQVDLSADNLESVVRTDPAGGTTEPTVSGDNIYQFVHDGWGGPGEYTMLYTLKDGTIIEAKINVVSFEFKPVVLDGELVPATDYPGYDSWKDAITEEGIDFGQITKDQAIAMGLPGVDYYGVAMYLEVDGEQVDLSADNLESVVRTDPAGGTTEPTVSGDNIYQFVHDGWGGPGEYTMLYTLKDGTIIEAKINVVSFEFNEKPHIPMEVTAEVEPFTVGVQQEFIVKTVANDDAGRMVRAYFELPEKATVEYYEVKDGNWYPLGNEYGPAEGFPVADATSLFRAVFSEAGTYTVTVEFKEVGTGEVVATHELEVTVIEYVPMAVSSEVPTFKVGKWQEYTVSTVANDDAGRMVRAYFELPEKATVEYYEVKDGNWYPLSNEYGPAEGFPVADATSLFRAVFSEAGTYTVTVEFKEVGTGEVVATHELEVTVEEPVKLELTEPVSHDAEAKTIVYSFNAEFKLVREFDKPWEIKASELTAEHAHLFQIYLLDENYNYEYPGSVKGEVKDVAWDGDTKTLTITYEGDLEPGRYLVDTWGYTISSLEDVPIDAAENFANAVFEVEKEPAIIADPGVSPADGTTVEGVQEFTFGFKSVTGELQELELDIYLGENTGEGRNYAQHLGINLPAGSDAVATWVDGVVEGYDQLDEKYHSILAAAGYNAEAGDDDNKQALKENIFYTAGDDGTGTWTIKLDTAVLGEEKVEFLVTVRDDAGAQWGNNNYVSYPNDVKAFLYNVTLPEPAIIADPGVSPADGTTVEGVQAFTFGFKSATGSLEELELDIYLGENTGENRDYAGHLGINLPAGSEAVASWVEQVVAGYGELDSKFHGLLAAAGYVVDAGDEANKQALKENIFYTAGDDGTGTWTIKLDTAVLGEEKVEFLVTVRDDAGAQWGNNNYVSYPNDVKAFLYNVTLPEPAIIADPGVSPADGTTVEGVQAFTFGFKSATGSLEELELDIYLGENTGENRDYAGHLGINLPAGSEAVASWVEQVVAGYGELDSKFHGLLAAAGYVVDAGDEANKQALKENIFYTAGDDGTGTWTIKLDTAVLGEEKVEFLVTVRDDAGAQWGNNNYVSYPNDVKAFLYNVTLPEPAIIADPGVSPADGTTVEGVQAFTFGFKSATGSLEELELDIYLGENTGENRDYAGHLGINLPAGSEAVASWVEQVVAGYGELDSKFHGLLAAAGYVVDAGDEANKQALKENIFYTAGDDGTGTWTIKLDTAVLDVEAIEFLVAVRDDQGAQWGNNNYVAYPDDVKAFLYNVTLPEPAITMTAGEPTIEDGKVTLAVTTKNTGADYENARYGIKVNAAGVEGDTISVSYGDEGLTFNLTRVEGTTDFIGYFGPADGFTITNGWDVTTTFTVDFGTAAEARTVLVDAWVGQAPTPAEEDAVAKMEQVEITIPAAEPEEYHTYKFNIEDLADEYIVREGLVDPNDDDFEDMTPVELSIVVDQAKDKAYEGKVRVAPINADGLQLWAKDTEDKWHDINQVGWGPAEGFPIDPELVTEVYVIATEALDDNVTLKLVDVTGDYGAEDNIIISQEVAVKAVVGPVSITKGESTTYYETIQAAIDDATENDQIEVAAGTFDEALSIGKSLTILGVNADNDATTTSFLDAGSTVTGGIEITAGDVTIKGLTIETKGILASNITGLTVVNNRIEEIGEAMEGSPAGSIIGLDVKTEATGPIEINQNRFSDIGQTDGTGTAIRMVKAKGSIDITDNIIKDVTKNGINLYSGCLANEDAKLTITGNEIKNWDSDKDNKEVGGRAIRIDFVGADGSATANITENKLTPPTYDSGETPVDSEYVKLTSVGIEVDLTNNYWGSATPDFETILSVAGEEASDCAYMPYYTDEDMTTLAESIEPEVTFTFTGLDAVTAGTVGFEITAKVTDNGAIAITPLRYKAVVTKGSEAWANQTIKYGEDYALTFTTDTEGVAYFGPSDGFTLTQLPELKGEGVTTSFQADFTAGNYSVTVSLVDISGGEEVELGSDTKTFSVEVLVYNGDVAGVITTSGEGNVSGSLNGDFNLTISGSVTEYDENVATFTGTVTGDIEGEITAKINAQGIDTLYGTVSNTGAEGTVRIIGTFPQTGIDGDFEGEIITGDELPAVTNLTIKGEEDVSTVAVGQELQMIAEIAPEGATDKVLWSVYVNDEEYGEINEEGVLTGKKAGTVTVIAKTLDDSSLAYATMTITVEASQENGNGVGENGEG